MKLSITGRHLEITPHLRQHIDQRFDRFTKLDGHIIAADVVLFRDRAVAVAEARLHLSHTVFTAKGSGSDMYLAVNDLVDKLHTQLKRYEDKLHSRKRAPSPRRRLE
uniref:Ribosome-associated translation inhibitor RaiA n=1 Tax=candidate division WOR-3 bacterium TaxID=2052148 RepID=A0A7C4GG92_UNCW3